MIHSHRSGLGPAFRPKLKRPQIQELTEIRIEVPQDEVRVAKPLVRKGLDTNQVHTVFRLLLEHSDALLEALEDQKESWWDKVAIFMRCKPQGNGMLKYLLWASQEQPLPADRQAQQQGSTQEQGEHAAAAMQNRPFRLNMNLRNHQGEYPILRAAQKGTYPNALRRLIQAGASLNVQDRDGRTALMHAIANGQKDSALALIKAGAKLALYNAEGRNALTYALMGETENHANMAEAIVSAHEQQPAAEEKEARDRELFQQKDEWGRIPLSYALENGFHEIADYLVAHSGDLNATDDYGISLLGYAAMDRGKDNLVHTLVANGAHVQVEDMGGRTPLLYAAGFGAFPALSKLLELGAAVNHADRRGRTACMYAARHKNAQVADAMLRTLFGHHSDLDAQDETGRTAVMHAAEAGRIGTLKTLERLGADFDRSDNDGNTALILAVMASQPESLKALCLLGADPNLKNATGQTAYQLARQQHDPAILRTFYELQGEADDHGNVIAFDGYEGAFADIVYDSDESEYSYLPI